MFIFIKQRKEDVLFSAVARLLVCVLSISLIFSPCAVQAQSVVPTVLNLPVPGTMVTPSPAFVPVLLKGMTIHPDDPLRFDFIIDSGNTQFTADEVKKESERLVKYFLAAMTVPKDDLWVNLSPNEPERIIPDELGKTELGRDMLAQDYILKQLTASLMYPEEELGKKFWDKVYKEAEERFGTSEIPVNTFNKVWIVPETATVYEHEQTVYVVDAYLKVMLDEDYMDREASSVKREAVEESPRDTLHEIRDTNVSSEIIREIIIPAIEKEVNQGAHFAPLRQIYHSLILAKWYKETIKNSLLSQVYVDQNKTAGIENDDPALKDKVYAQYMEAYKKGVFNYIKEDYVAMEAQQADTATPYAPAEGDRLSQEMIPRKYFSGGLSLDTDVALRRTDNPVVGNGFKGDGYTATVSVMPQKDGASSPVALPWTKQWYMNLIKNSRTGEDGLKGLRGLLKKGREASNKTEYIEFILTHSLHYGINYIEASIKALEELGVTKERLFNRYRDDMYSGDSHTRIRAAGALGVLGDIRAVEPLLDRLENDRDWQVQEAAVESLGKLGDQRAVEPLIKLVRTPRGPYYSYNFAVVNEVVEAFGKLKNPRAIETLEWLLGKVPATIETGMPETGPYGEDWGPSSWENPTYLSIERVLHILKQSVLKGGPEAMSGKKDQSSSPVSVLGKSSDVSENALIALGLPAEASDLGAWFHEGHRPSALYHDLAHSRDVAGAAYVLAKARGLSGEQALFLYRVGLLHDFDPGRDKDTPARVSATLQLLEDDFSREKSLDDGDAGWSVLRDQFGWKKKEYLMAKAIIARSEHPFEVTHFDPAYKDVSPVAQYENLLNELATLDRDAARFVAEWAPFFSEYADKSNASLIGGIRHVVGRSKALAVEFFTAGRLPTLDEERFAADSYKGFFATLGQEGSFVYDKEIAAKLGFTDVKFLTLEDALAVMPEAFAKRFRANVEASRKLAETYEPQLNNFDAALAAAEKVYLDTYRTFQTPTLERSASSPVDPREASSVKREAGKNMEYTPRDMSDNEDQSSSPLEIFSFPHLYINQDTRTAGQYRKYFLGGLSIGAEGNREDLVRTYRKNTDFMLEKYASDLSVAKNQLERIQNILRQKRDTVAIGIEYPNEEFRDETRIGEARYAILAANLMDAGYENYAEKAKDIYLLLTGPAEFLLLTGDPLLNEVNVIPLDSDILRKETAQALSSMDDTIPFVLGGITKEAAKQYKEFLNFADELRIPSEEEIATMIDLVRRNINPPNNADLITRLAEDGIRQHIRFLELAFERDRYMAEGVREQGKDMIVSLGSAHIKGIQEILSDQAYFDENGDRFHQDGRFSSSLVDPREALSVQREVGDDTKYAAKQPFDAVPKEDLAQGSPEPVEGQYPKGTSRDTNGEPDSVSSPIADGVLNLLHEDIRPLKYDISPWAWSLKSHLKRITKGDVKGQREIAKALTVLIKLLHSIEGEYNYNVDINKNENRAYIINGDRNLFFYKRSLRKRVNQLLSQSESTDDMLKRIKIAAEIVQSITKQLEFEERHLLTTEFWHIHPGNNLIDKQSFPVDKKLEDYKDLIFKILLLDLIAVVNEIIQTPSKKPGDMGIIAYKFIKHDTYSNAAVLQSVIGQKTNTRAGQFNKNHVVGVESVSNNSRAKVIPLFKDSKEPKSSSPVSSEDEVGGIDMNDINVERQGSGVDIQFDPVQVQQIIDLGIDGFAPVIINIVPLPSVLPLLGLAPNKEEELEVSSLN